LETKLVTGMVFHEYMFSTHFSVYTCDFTEN